MSEMLGSVEAFVRERTGHSKRTPITAETRLEDDLDLTGIEAENFMDSFFAVYEVESGDYRFDRYFVGEGSGLILSLVTLLSKKRRDALKRVPITVGMLADAAERRRWISSEIERGSKRQPSDLE
jgi:hypothetical protein